MFYLCEKIQKLTLTAITNVVIGLEKKLIVDKISMQKMGASISKVIADGILWVLEMRYNEAEKPCTLKISMTGNSQL